ncbi:putative acetyltransferase [Rhizomicrobium palustre]|uniref:Putative acetyltransferase n=1 Tax=Rhizomicrobium palustre TaxID=189966 RepID=A0A846MZ54_9PROT|nr:GNAT family N-acetyltransferase [Rhizomicrobium palustre]NIK88217.1 putative acetyltransferase [Rhizomicrobium palustre]
MSLVIARDDLSRAETRDLLTYHYSHMHENTPPEHVFALDLEGLKKPGITLWSAWEGEKIAGIAALRDLGDGLGEIKSMRTHPDFLRRGVAGKLLDHIVEAATARGYRRLSLETGVGDDFTAAIALYESRGFAKGEKFADYPATEYNQFYHLDLTAPGA